MASAAIIEQMKLSEKDEVLAFLRKVFPDSPRQYDPAFWTWHFPDSPYCDPDDLPIWLAKVDGTIAGQLAAVPVELNISGEAVRAIWILDLVVDSDFRRRGIAKKLALASLEYCPYVLGVNTNKQHAPKMLKALGWNIFSKIPRFQKFLFPGNAVRELERLGPLRGLANLIFAPSRRTGPRRGDRYEVRMLDGFDPSFDELWSRAAKQWPCSVSRSAAILDWQYCRQPGKKFDILACYESDTLTGYAVMFFRRSNERGSITKCAISDLCYRPEDADATIDTLLGAAVDLAIERRAGSIVTDAIDARLEHRLENFGFWRVKSDLQLQANVPRKQDVVYDRKNWYLTRGDSDISIFEEPNL